MPWVIGFFFKWEENEYFSPYAYCFIYKSDLLNPNFVGKKKIYTDFLINLLSMSKVTFWFFNFIETKSINIYSFTNDNEMSLSVVGVKFLRRKEKKVCC